MENSLEKELRIYMNMSSFASKKEFISKHNKQYYFVNVNFDMKNGDIYFLENAGYLHYKILDNEVYIIDIVSKVGNIGLGSAALKFLEEICYEKDIKKIKGSISQFDDYEKLKYFYEKNSFEVYKIENTNNYVAKIEKKL